MAISTINTGTPPTGAGGDTHAQAWAKGNANFSELAPGIVTKSADFTIEAGHANKTLRMTAAGVVTIPPGLGDGFSCALENVSGGVVSFALGAGVTTVPATLPTLDNSGPAEITVAALQHVTGNAWDILTATPEPVDICVALSDETTALTTGTAKVTLHSPFAFTLTSVFAAVNTAPTGANLVVDVNESGVSVLSTKLSIDATETTSATAATPAVIGDASIAAYAPITFDIDAVGSTVAGAGLKVWLRGYR